MNSRRLCRGRREWKKERKREKEKKGEERGIAPDWREGTVEREKQRRIATVENGELWGHERLFWFDITGTRFISSNGSRWKWNESWWKWNGWKDKTRQDKGEWRGGGNGDVASCVELIESLLTLTLTLTLTRTQTRTWTLIVCGTYWELSNANSSPNRNRNPNAWRTVFSNILHPSVVHPWRC